MSTRISSALLFLALAACGERQTNTQVLAQVEAEQGARAADDGRIQCALGSDSAFARVCTLDREESDRGLLLTARHPDGGFRRLLVTRDGRGVIAADGATPAIVTIVAPDEIEVSIADDHYRLPATVRGEAEAGATPTP